MGYTSSHLILLTIHNADPTLETQEPRLEREHNLLRFTQWMVVKPGLKTRLTNSRAQGFNDILLTLRLTKIQILPRFTASVDLLLHLLERTAVDRQEI